MKPSDIPHITDDFRMIFNLEGHILPHIERLFEAFDVAAKDTGLFMNYYCSQILRFELFGTIESEFALNLKTANLLKLLPVKIEEQSQTFVCAQALVSLQNDIQRLKRRLKLMSVTEEPFDCFTSESEDFKGEQYFLTQSRLEAELQSGMTPFLWGRLMCP